LNAIYEADFLDCSYGFRPGRSAHQALRTVREAITTEPVRSPVRPGSVILEFHRRGWLSPGRAAAGLAFACDIVAVEEAPAEDIDPATRATAGKRLAHARKFLSVPQFDMLEAVARYDHAPGLWAKVNGYPAREACVAYAIP
jgi:hypothetical protein